MDDGLARAREDGGRARRRRRRLVGGGGARRGTSRARRARRRRVPRNGNGASVARGDGRGGERDGDGERADARGGVRFGRKVVADDGIFRRSGDG